MNDILAWLWQGDRSVRWQTLQDLLHDRPDKIEAQRKQVASEGWGAALLARQDACGSWGGGLYSPKWISTTYTMLLLKRLGLPVENSQAKISCALLLEKGFFHDGGIAFSRSWGQSETCVTGMILSILSYFHYLDQRVTRLAEYLLGQQMPDGGWNCQSFKGATHSSFHTTISVLEGLREFEKNYTSSQSAIFDAQQQGKEFLLKHRPFRSSRTGEIVKQAFTQFSFPPRWFYDILRALDYFQETNSKKDERLSDAIKIVEKKRKKEGWWLLQNRHRGRTFFEMERVGEPSRWNTLRALRILNWWESK